ALNNICAAYNNLYRFEEAKFFCKKALEKDSANQLAKNNLAYAEDQIQRIIALQQKTDQQMTKEDYVQLGIYHYKRREFARAADIFQRGINKFPQDVLLLNNLCASFCELKQWDKALPYCEEAVSLQPDYALARNNLQWARDGKAGKYN
ncbi:MAG: hypothetical protein NZ522_05345, partial [Chitinophagales bacterium]|nr:hypothetical protein [Chitinophagales bacterium]